MEKTVLFFSERENIGANAFYGYGYYRIMIIFFIKSLW